MLGWFGGPGFAGEVELLTSAVGLPAVIAALVILIEFLPPLALAVGLAAPSRSTARWPRGSGLGVRRRRTPGRDHPTRVHRPRAP